MAAQPSDLSPTRTAAIPHDDPGIGVNYLCVHLSNPDNSRSVNDETVRPRMRFDRNENFMQHYHVQSIYNQE